jgi:hypothetical protein
MERSTINSTTLSCPHVAQNGNLAFISMSLASVDLDYSADSIEFCPFPETGEYFTCGTYQLSDVANDGSQENAAKERLGRLYLFKVQDNDGDISM